MVEFLHNKSNIDDIKSKQFSEEAKRIRNDLKQGQISYI